MNQWVFSKKKAMMLCVSSTKWGRGRCFHIIIPIFAVKPHRHIVLAGPQFLIKWSGMKNDSC